MQMLGMFILVAIVALYFAGKMDGSSNNLLHFATRSSAE